MSEFDYFLNYMDITWFGNLKLINFDIDTRHHQRYFLFWKLKAQCWRLQLLSLPSPVSTHHQYNKPIGNETFSYGSKLININYDIDSLAHLFLYKKSPFNLTGQTKTIGNSILLITKRELWNKNFSYKYKITVRLRTKSLFNCSYVWALVNFRLEPGGFHYGEREWNARFWWAWKLYLYHSRPNEPNQILNCHYNRPSNLTL